MKQYKKVFVAGVFDNFHIGHQYLLWTASQIAEQMVIVVARDTTVEKIKGRASKNNEIKRLDRIKEEGIPNSFIRLGRSDGQFWKTLEEENPDVLCLGYDQNLNEQDASQRFPHLVIHRCRQFFPQYFKSSKY